MDPQLFRRPSNESFQPHENQTSGNSIIQNPRFVIAQIIQTNSRVFSNSLKRLIDFFPIFVCLFFSNYLK